MKFKRNNFRIAAFLDTETTNILNGTDSVSFVCLYILNAISCNVVDYEVEKSDRIYYFFDHSGIIKAINSIRRDYNDNGYIPVFCCYNLLFDIKSLMHELSNIYRIEVLAKSSTNPYTIDFYMNDKLAFRFWDMFYLDQRGVSALGDACGLEKLNGFWDYNLIRTPKTPLTDEEYSYAARDVQVLPAYLKWLLGNNKNIKESMLGVNCITKTSLVRIDAKYNIGSLKKGKGNVYKAFNYLCYKNKPYDYISYLLRTSTFRGGFTFTAGNSAFRIYHDVTSLDVTSMHHAFINGSLTPIEFKHNSNVIGEMLAQIVINTDLNKMLDKYSNPFGFGFNGCFLFKNIRLKKDSLFEKQCIACLAETRFYRKDITDEIRDECINGVFSFSKLLSADTAKLCLTEFELWNVKTVYDFDSIECLKIETSEKMITPPEYVTLQSNKLFKQKTICKNVLKGKRDYSNDELSFMPEKFVSQIQNDCLDSDDFEIYYINTIKGMFNGIYGTQAMNPIKDRYIVDENGNIKIDESFRVNENNFKEINDNTKWTFYTFGSRIVGRSRTHLIIAMVLLDEYFKNRIKILGGDTDSIKIACDNVKDNEIMDALKPLHDAVTNAIYKSQTIIRKNYPELASDFKNVGCFEIETDENNRYKHHMEYWNKARISIDKNDKVHLVFAGLPSRKSDHGILEVLQKAYDIYGVKECFNLLGFNVEIDSNISKTLEHKVPNAETVLNLNVTDYLGNTECVKAYATISLYPSTRKIGDISALINKENYNYLINKGLDLDCCNKELVYKNGFVEYYCRGELKLKFEMD